MSVTVMISVVMWRGWSSPCGQSSQAPRQCGVGVWSSGLRVPERQHYLPAVLPLVPNRCLSEYFNEGIFRLNYLLMLSLTKIVSYIDSGVVFGIRELLLNSHMITVITTVVVLPQLAVFCSWGGAAFPVVLCSTPSHLPRDLVWVIVSSPHPSQHLLYSPFLITLAQNGAPFPVRSTSAGPVFPCSFCDTLNSRVFVTLPCAPHSSLCLPLPLFTEMPLTRLPVSFCH